MNNTQEYLKYLLGRQQWTNGEKEWMLQYLEGEDLSDLETVAEDEFNMDLATMKHLLDRKASERILEKIHQRIGTPRAGFWATIRLRKWKLAAAALVIVVAGSGYMFRDTWGRWFNPVQMVEVATATHERKIVYLPDSSTVSLEPNTVLSYPGEFNGETREVKLKGEAFFEVTKDAQHPFIIRTQFIDATVLGTSFNVQANGDQHARIVVVTGRVKVEPVGKEKQGNEVIVSANQSVIYSQSTGKLVKEEAQQEAKFCAHRREGKFIYDGMDVIKVLDDMQRFFGIPIKVQGKMKDCAFYGYFEVTDKPDMALTMVAASINATVKKDADGDGYTITGDGCQ